VAAGSAEVATIVSAVAQASDATLGEIHFSVFMSAKNIEADRAIPLRFDFFAD
jgi:hypothetical protein